MNEEQRAAAVGSAAAESMAILTAAAVATRDPKLRERRCRALLTFEARTRLVKEAIARGDAGAHKRAEKRARQTAAEIERLFMEGE